MTDSPSQTTAQPASLSQVMVIFGYIIAITYPLLALSTGVRAVFQLYFRPDITDKLGPALTALAALIYLVAAVGFVVRQKWAWQMSVVTLVIELIAVVVIGLLSFVMVAAFEHTSWRYFGLDYGFIPLIQPFLGLAWLLWPQTRKVYGIG
jgi:hypothetical protein